MVDRYIDYVEDHKMVQAERDAAIRQLLIGYFDSDPCQLTEIPDTAVLQKQFGNRLLHYDCRMKPGELKEIRDGHTLMERGYYILEGQDKAALLQDRERLLQQVFMNCVR